MLGVPVRSKLHIKSQEHALAAREVHSILGAIHRSTVRKQRDTVNPLYSALIRPHLDSTSSFGLPPQEGWQRV